jgi:hypothetical protein
VRWTRSKAVHGLIKTGHTAVVDADLRGYFDEIPHGPLMKSVARSSSGLSEVGSSARRTILLAASESAPNF